MLRYLTAGALTVALLPATLAAQETRPAPAPPEVRAVSLSEARAEARVNSRAARAAMAEATAARQGERAATAGRWPTLGVQAGAMRSNDPVAVFGSRLRQGAFTAADFDPVRLNHPDPFTDWNASAGASWVPLDLSREAAASAAGAEADAAGMGAEWAARAAEFTAVVSWLEALAAAERLATAESALEAAGANLRRTEQRAAQGLLTDADLLQARAAAEGARAAVIDAGRMVDDAHDRLTLALGWDDGIIAVPDASALPSFTAGGAESPELATRPDLAASTHALRGAEDRVSQASRARLPRLEAFAAVSAHANEPFSGAQDNWTVGFQVSVPLFTGFEIGARKKAAEAMLDATRLAHEDRLARARVELDGAARAVQAATGRVEAAGAASEAASEAARLMRRRFEEGLATVADLLSAEARAAEMASAAVDARLALHAASARVEFLTPDSTPNTDPASTGGNDR